MASNFLEIGEALSNIALKMAMNQKITKLLYYNDQRPLEHPDVDLQNERNNLLNKNIILVPNIDLQNKKTSYLSIVTAEGSVNENDEFSTIYICIDIVVPFDLWLINHKSTRPILLMDEIKKTLNGSKVSSIGTLNFDTYTFDIPTDEVGIYKMIFEVDILG